MKFKHNIVKSTDRGLYIENKDFFEIPKVKNTIIENKISKILNKRKNTINFELDKEQFEKYKKWEETLPNVDFGAAGGGLHFIFTPTGLGTLIKVKRDDGYELDLTDFENW